MSLRYEDVLRWLQPRRRTLDEWALPDVIDLVPLLDDPAITLRTPYVTNPGVNETVSLVPAVRRLLQTVPLALRFAAAFVAFDGVLPAIDRRIRFDRGGSILRPLVDALWRLRAEPVRRREISGFLIAVRNTGGGMDVTVVDGHPSPDATVAVIDLAGAVLAGPTDTEAIDALLERAIASVILLRLHQWCPDDPRPRVSAVRRELTRWWHAARRRLALRDAADPQTDATYLDLQ